MGILLDIVLILLIVFFIYRASCKGFVKSLFDIIGYFAAVVVAFFVGKVLANWIYSIGFKSSIETSISSSLSQITSAASASDTVTSVFDVVPKFVASLMKFFGVTSESALGQLGDSSAITAATSPEALADTVAKPVLTTIFTFVLFFILFIVCIFLLRWIATLINRIFSSSVLGPVNMVLGGVLGIVKALVFLFLLTTILGLYMNISGSDFSASMYEAIGSTTLVKMLFGWNPLVIIPF